MRVDRDRYYETLADAGFARGAVRRYDEIRGALDGIGLKYDPRQDVLHLLAGELGVGFADLRDVIGGHIAAHVRAYEAAEAARTIDGEAVDCGTPRLPGR